MASNVIEFNLDVTKFVTEEAPEEATKLHRALALDLFGRLIRTTPVDTGRARANWQVSNGQPPAGEIEFEGGASREANGALALNTAQQRETPEILAAKAPGRTWIANNLPYIERLNDGWSAQAPAGFVELAIAEVERR